MFTGIVESIGFVKNIVTENDCVHFTITSSLPFTDIIIGDSIAVNGVCLTVTDIFAQDFKLTVVPETLRLTNLGTLAIQQSINLERSMKADGRMGGHYVQGHVDGIGKILELDHDGKAALLVKIQVPSKLSQYIVAKGYITLDGMSLTVITAQDNWFTVTLIPHTQAVTIAKHYTLGTEVNVEVDILGKYVEKLLQAKLATLSC